MSCQHDNVPRCMHTLAQVYQTLNAMCAVPEITQCMSDSTEISLSLLNSCSLDCVVILDDVAISYIMLFYSALHKRKDERRGWPFSLG